MKTKTWHILTVILIVVGVVSLFFGRHLLVFKRTSERASVASVPPTFSTSSRWRIFKREPFLGGFGAEFEFPESWQIFDGESYLLFYAGEPQMRENEMSPKEADAWLQLWLRDTASLSPEEWLQQGRSLYSCSDAKWFTLSGHKAVRCAPVAVKETKGEFIEMQVYLFPSRHFAFVFLISINAKLDAATQEMHLRSFEYLLSSFRLL